MERANSYLSLMPVTKAEIKSFTTSLKNEILSGEVHPLGVALQLKAMEEVITTLRKDKDVQAEIIARIDGKKMEYGGATLEIRNKPTYVYTSDAKWNEINTRMEVLKDELKNRQEFLKVLQEEIVDPNTGEIISPIVVLNEESLVVSFKTK